MCVDETISRYYALHGTHCEYNKLQPDPEWRNQKKLEFMFDRKDRMRLSGKPQTTYNTIRDPTNKRKDLAVKSEKREKNSFKCTQGMPLMT